MVLTYISLLIPAFSLELRPPSLSLWLRPCSMLLYQSFLIPQLRCRVLAPDIFGAGPLD